MVKYNAKENYAKLICSRGASKGGSSRHKET
jgi:hypothetical protein